MDRKIFFNFTLFDFRKLIGLTFFWFFALHLFFWKYAQPVSMIQVDYFSQEEESGMHHSAESLFHSQLSPCTETKDASLCAKVSRSGTISEQDKLNYLSQYLAIIHFLDEKLMKGRDIKRALQTLIINGEEGKRRGGATWKRITLNLASMKKASEFWGVLTHEFGHIVDLGVLQGISPFHNQEYTEFGKVKFENDDPSLEYYAYSRQNETIRSANADKKDFCSGYGMTNPFEDFAECHNLYLNNRQLFRTMAAETSVMQYKYNYFANLFDNQVMQDNNQQLLYPEWRPRDTTVL